ncbi:MAG TPA: cytidylate kinase-like family protein [Desulfatirhabdiaceae bacterium]|nr:cytidylate kinase-like family protein [Desulfatirhabdiaceae bacterium]
MSVITISRQYGSGGKSLGIMLSKELGYALYDEELIQMIAQKAKVSTSWVENMEKEAGGKFSKFISGLIPSSFMDRLLDDNRGYLDEEIYVDILQKLMRKIGDEGNSVIVGRGGQYVLRDDANAFHILMVADLEDRVQFMEQRYDLSPKQALQIVNRQDKRRVNLYRKFGKEDYDQPDLYHIVLNMSKLSLEKACDLVQALIEPIKA